MTGEISNAFILAGLKYQPDKKEEKAMERKIFPSLEFKEQSKRELKVTAVISSQKKDRSGDEMVSAGCRVVDDCVPVLYGHGMGPLGNMPVGKVLSVWAGEHKGYPAVLSSFQLYPDQDGEKIYDKLTNGYLGQFSVGFLINKFIPIDGGGKRVEDWVLLEVSVVPIGCSFLTGVLETSAFQGIQMKFLTSDSHVRRELNLGQAYKHDGKLKIWIPDELIQDLTQKAIRDGIDRLKGRVK